MKKLILIVEDEPRNMKLVSDLLKVFGYVTVEATNGERGVKFAKARKPNLILMDIQMPKMDGFEATRILKADVTTKDIPIVALTSYAMKGDKERVLEVGFDEYISKPIDIHQLLKIVGKYLPG